MSDNKDYIIAEFIQAPLSEGDFRISFKCHEGNIITIIMNGVQIAEAISILTKEIIRRQIHNEYNM